LDSSLASEPGKKLCSLSYFHSLFLSLTTMENSTIDLATLIAQTEALSWNDPSSQLTTLSDENQPEDILALVGFVVNPKPCITKLVFDALKKSWPFASPFFLEAQAKNIYLLTFSHPSHITKILKQVTWNINGSLLVLKKWSPTLSIRDITFHTSPFWIQVHGLPLKYMLLKNAVAIGKSLGVLLEVDNADSLGLICRSFLRILVEIDIRKPLEPGSCLHRPDGPPIRIELKYERLDDYCVSCGLIGHKTFECNSTKAPLPPDRYPVSLKASPFYRFWAAPPSRVRDPLPIEPPESSQAGKSSQANSHIICSPLLLNLFPMHAKIFPSRIYLPPNPVDP
jgi:hypothetical protein